jgi:hypothetical protein
VRVHFDEVVLLGAFVLTLAAYVALSILGDPTGRLEDLLIALGGAIAAITVPRGASKP